MNNISVLCFVFLFRPIYSITLIGVDSVALNRSSPKPDNIFGSRSQNLATRNVARNKLRRGWTFRCGFSLDAMSSFLPLCQWYMEFFYFNMWQSMVYGILLLFWHVTVAMISTQSSTFQRARINTSTSSMASGSVIITRWAILDFTMIYTLLCFNFVRPDENIHE